MSERVRGLTERNVNALYQLKHMSTELAQTNVLSDMKVNGLQGDSREWKNSTCTNNMRNEKSVATHQS